MNTLDIIVLAIIALSGLFAFARGFVREALSIGAWIGAALIAIYGFPLARPVARQLIGAPTIADIAAGVVLFLVPLILLTLVTAAIASRVKGSSLSALDRTLGFVFGLARGALIACLAFMAFSWAVPQEKNWPDWALHARTRPFLTSGADMLESLVPGHTRARGAATAAGAQRLYEQAREAERAMRALTAPAATLGEAARTAPAAPVYKPAERKEMQRLIESAQ